MNKYEIVYAEGDKDQVDSYKRNKNRIIRRLWPSGKGITYIVDTGNAIKIVTKKEDTTTELVLDYCDFGDLIQAAMIWRHEGNDLTKFSIHKSEDIGGF
jgi:hypothetical protein